MPRETIYLNEETLKDLIAVHLQAVNAVPSSLDITDIVIYNPIHGKREITYTIEPKKEIIFHE